MAVPAWPPTLTSRALIEDGEITAAGAAVRTLRIRAREDLEMAWQARATLQN